MQPPQTEAIERAHWEAFVGQLAEHLAAQWPAMPERLGERYQAFVETAVAQAEKRGLARAATIARYVNLNFVWGPSFHDKPGFEWAAGLLAAPREQEWSTMHRLVRRSLAELQRLPDARIAPDALAAADERLLDRFGLLGRRGALHPYEPPPAPRRACDVEAAELRLLEPAITQHYVLEAGQWQRAALPAPAPLRVTAADPMPRLVGVLSQPPGHPQPARLQWRTRTHAVCDVDLHPALSFAGSHGLWRWHGHEARAVSWPVATLEQPAPPPGTVIAEETSPDIFKLDLAVCGLRDDGDPIGSLAGQVWVWPAEQWWLELQRGAPAAQPVGGSAPPRAATRCRVERDGVAQDASALRDAFEQGLDAAVAEALQKLNEAWQAVDGIASPRLEGLLALLVGRAAFTWGWRLGAAGLDGRALMRVLGELEMQACQSELAFEGELADGEARSRLLLRCAGKAPLKLDLRRETAEPPLLAALMPARTSFRFPFEAELLPLAADSGTLLQAAGPCAGALAGEAGLRPRTSGGSGWEWFVQLRLEPVTLPVESLDPLLGSQRHVLALLPAATLLDWKLA
ncbi:MAG: hypothetical protein KF683_13585 [Rubrivivax sp.]|nr:hypothetical protein [Rubrivivax sp.]